jgi:hypothetical protein
LPILTVGTFWCFSLSQDTAWLMLTWVVGADWQKRL